MAGALGNLIPLIVLFVFLAGAGFIGYQLYLWSNELADRGKKKMEQKNISFSKDGGLKVGVKEMREDEYADKQQGSVQTAHRKRFGGGGADVVIRYLVKAWNYSSFPAYKSRLGWNKAAQEQSKAPSGKATPPATSRTSSSTSSSRQANLAAPAPRPNTQRSASSVPGSFD